MNAFWVIYAAQSWPLLLLTIGFHVMLTEYDMSKDKPKDQSQSGIESNMVHGIWTTVLHM